MAEEETAQAEQESTSTEEKTYTEAEVQELINGLKSNRDELLGEVKTFKQKAREKEEEARREREAAAKKTGDFEAYERSWTEKYTTLENELKSQLTEREQIIANLTVGNTAKTLATELALKGSETVLERLISDRLGFEIVEGKQRVFVKDAAGQRSALTIEDLKTEIRADAALKPILQGTQAAGAGGVSRNGGAGTGSTIAASELEKMTPQQKFAYFKANPGVSVQT